MNFTLNDYIYRTQKFLRDSLGTGYDVNFLTYCINQARCDAIYFSRCSRALALINLVPAQELYPFSMVQAQLVTQGTPALQVLTVLNCTIEYSSTPLRIALDYLPWSYFNAIYRSFPIQIYPTIWSQYDYQSFYVAPIPSQVYVLEVDCLFIPNDLVNLTDAETTIPQPWCDIVPVCACYWAKMFEQAKEDVAYFEELAMKRFNVRLGATPPWRMPSQYGSAFTN